jgi:hypothetical protein
VNNLRPCADRRPAVAGFDSVPRGVDSRLAARTMPSFHGLPSRGITNGLRLFLL